MSTCRSTRGALRGAAPVAILTVIAATTTSALPAGQGQWTVVDIGSAENACEAIQAALNPYLIEKKREGRQSKPDARPAPAAVVRFDDGRHHHAGRSGHGRVCFIAACIEESGFAAKPGAHARRFA